MAKVFELQSSNYTEIQLVATADIAAGALVTAGAASRVFTVTNVLDTEQYTGIQKAEKVLCQKAAVAIVAGEPIYHDSGADKVTNLAAAGANKLVGFAQKSAEAGDATCYITFDGTAEFLKA